MTKIVRSRDCGNSPKNLLIENLAVALVTGDRRTAASLLTADVQWNIVGGKVLSGREAVLQELEDVNSKSIVQLTVWHAVTHGKAGAVNGLVQFRETTQGFCDVFEFSSAKGTSVSQITSYRINA